MGPIILFLLMVLFLAIFIKRKNIYENAYWNIPTRFCDPTRFTSPYDYRGTIDIPQKYGTLLFDQSEAVGKSEKYCFDEYRQDMD